MNKDVYKYFTDFSKRGLKTENNIILLDQPQIVKIVSDNGSINILHKAIEKYKNGDKQFYVKDEINEDGLYGLASSKMYGELGIQTPQTFPVRDSIVDNEFLIASEDVYSIGLTIGSPDIVLAEFIAEYQERKHNDGFSTPKYTSEMWTFVRNPEHKERLLEIMTEDCYEQLVSLFILDTLRTDSDRHPHNFFFYKNSGTGKWEGVIPIDLEFGEILNTLPWDKAEDTLQEFFRYSYRSRTPYSRFDIAASYPERMIDLLKLIQEDKLSPKQIKVLQAAMRYDFPKSIADITKHYGFSTDGDYDQVYELASLLWEYNQKNLGKELGI